MADAGKIIFDWGTAVPGTPGAGKCSLYAKADGKPYWKTPAGTEYDLSVNGLSPAFGPAGTVYLAASGGSDSTGTAGNPALPFATLKRALQECKTIEGVGTYVPVLRVGPGTHAVTTGTTPLTTDVPNRLFVVGEGGRDAEGYPLSVISTFDPSVDFFPLPLTATGASFKDVAMINGGAGGSIIYADGIGGAGSFLGFGLVMDHVTAIAATTSVFVRYVGSVVASHCSLDGAQIDSCKRLKSVDCEWGESLTLRYDADAGADLPSGGVGDYNFWGGTIKDIILEEQPNCWFSSTTRHVGTWTMTSLSEGSGPTYPKMRFEGFIEQSQTITLPDITGTIFTYFTGAKGSLGVGLSITVAGSAVNRQTVFTDGLMLQGNLVANAGVDIKGKQMQVKTGDMSVTGSGTITPDVYFGQSTAATPTATWTFGFTASAAPDIVLASPRTLGDGPVAVTARAAGSATLTTTGGSSACDCVAYWSF